jgi:hypothetical protein
MDDYRLLDHKDEIFKMAKKAPVVEIGEIWQTLPSKREIYRIKKMEVLSEAMVFLTTLPFEFENDFPIYIRLNYKNLIFKLTPHEYRTYNNQLSCVFPKNAKAKEDRLIERAKLPKKTSLNLVLRTFTRGATLDIKVSLEDVSENGVGVRTSIFNQEYFHKNAVFKIVKICGKNQMEVGVLSVCHVSLKANKGLIGIGLSSSVTFSDKLFEILRQELKRERFIYLP